MEYTDAGQIIDKVASANREKLGGVLRKRAQNLEREAKMLYDLAKSLDLLPEVLEAQLYPFVTGYINIMDRSLNRTF